MENEFRFEGLVKTNPIMLYSKKTGNTFVKFTVRNDPDNARFLIKKIKSEGRVGDGPINYGQSYIDCFLEYKEKDGNTAKYALENVHKGDVIKAVGAIRSGRKPVKEEGDKFRANWVYGDYLYVNVKKIEVIKKAEERKVNPYRENSEFEKSRYYGRYRYNQVKSYDQYVSDDELIFDI